METGGMDLLNPLDDSFLGTEDSLGFPAISSPLPEPDGSPFLGGLPYGELLSPLPEPDFGGVEFLELLPNDFTSPLETDFLATMSPKDIERTIREKPHCATEELLGALSDNQLHKLFKREPLLVKICSQDFWKRRCEILFPRLFEFAKDLDTKEFKWSKLYSESCLIPETMPFEVTPYMVKYAPLIRFLSTLECNLTEFVFSNSHLMNRVLRSGAELKNASIHLDFCLNYERFSVVKDCATFGYYPSASTLISLCQDSFPTIPDVVMHFLTHGTEPKTDVMEFWSDEFTGRLIFRQLLETWPEYVVKSETTGLVINTWKRYAIPDYFVRHYASVNDSDMCELIEAHRKSRIHCFVA